MEKKQSERKVFSPNDNDMVRTLLLHCCGGLGAECSLVSDMFWLKDMVPDVSLLNAHDVHVCVALVSASSSFKNYCKIHLELVIESDLYT